MGRPFLRVCHATFAQRQLDLDWSAQFHLEYVWNTIGIFFTKTFTTISFKVVFPCPYGTVLRLNWFRRAGEGKKRNPNLRGKNPRPRSSKSWHNEWSSELAMFWARTINNRKRWSWLTLLEWTIWTHRRRKKRQGLALKILQKSTNIPEKNAYANLEKIIDFIFQISVGMPRNAEIDEILNSLNIFTYWKVRRYLYPKSKARKKMSRMRYVFCSRFISDHETTKKCTCRNVYKKTCASCGHHGFGIAWCVIRRPTYVPRTTLDTNEKRISGPKHFFPNVFAQQLVLRDLYILSNIKTPDMSTIFARETNLNINIYFFIVRWWGRNLKKKQCMIATQKMRQLLCRWGDKKVANADSWWKDLGTQGMAHTRFVRNKKRKQFHRSGEFMTYQATFCLTTLFGAFRDLSSCFCLYFESITSKFDHISIIQGAKRKFSYTNTCAHFLGNVLMYFLRCWPGIPFGKYC